jgi:intracellular septation protein
MKFLFDLFPVILFFIAFKIPDDPHQGVLLATAVAIGASFLQVGISWLKHRRVENMHLITLAILVLLGGATLVFQDERFIKWKPTAVNWLFAVAFLGSQFIGEKNLIRRMMETNITLPDGIWSRLNISWAIFFTAMGLANLYVAFNFETATWVNFKLFGIMGLTLLFVLVQALFLGRYVEEPEETKRQ